MIVVMSDHTGEHHVEVNDDPETVGHRVVNGGGGLFSPAPGVACFLESPGVGARPWVCYVHLVNETGEPNFTNLVRTPLHVSRILRVIR